MKYWHCRKQSQVWRHGAIHLSKRGHFWKLLIAWCYWDKICAASQASAAPIPAERSLAYWTFLRLLICAERLQWVVEQKAADMTGWFAGAGHKSGLDEKGFIAELKVLVQDNGKEMHSTQNSLQQSWLVFPSLSVFWRSFCTLKGRRWVSGLVPYKDL